MVKSGYVVKWRFKISKVFKNSHFVRKKKMPSYETDKRFDLLKSAVNSVLSGYELDLANPCIDRFFNDQK